MVVNKRSKKSRQRGSKTHGWGAKKKHRGAGNRGGKGMAGTGKSADTRKPSIWKEEYFGKFGFNPKGLKEEIKTVDLRFIGENLDRLVKEKLMAKEGDYYVLDLAKLNFNKLLGNGRATKKFKITAKYASSSAIEKVKKVGGEVLVK